MARAIRASRDSNITAVKPVPAPDIWKEMQAIAKEIGLQLLVECPPDGFSAAMYARQLNVAPSTASAWLRAMRAAGKLEYIGRGINNAKFYRIVKK